MKQADTRPSGRSISRRSFLALSAASLASLAIPSWTYAEERAAKDGGIVIVYTNDVHCAYAFAEAVDSNKNPLGYVECFGYDALAGYVAELRETYANVALVDAGDAVQGQTAGTLSQGAYLVDIMNACGYDVAIPGNHEFDFGMDQFNTNMGNLDVYKNKSYLSCNFTTLRTGDLVLPPGYVVKEYEVGTDTTTGEGVIKRVAYVGVTTPATLTSCSPKSFKDADGNIAYGFCEDESGQALYDAIQAAVDAALAAGQADYVVLLAHLGQTGAPDRWRSDTVAKNTTGIDVIIDGHSHEQYVQVVANSAGQNVIIVQTGTLLTSIGRVIIDPSGEIHVAEGDMHESAITTHCTTLDSALVEAAPVSDSGDADKTTELRKARLTQAQTWVASDGAKAAAAAVQTVTTEVEKQTGTVVGTSLVKLWATEDDNYTWAVRVHETNCGDFVADAYWNIAYQAGLKDDGSKLVALVNGGGVRKNLEAGDVTNGALININPFNNQLCYATVSGQTLLDALEMCVSADLATDAEGKVIEPMQLASNGNFPQVSGITFDVRIDIESSVEIDDGGNFVSVGGEYRVRNVVVEGDPLDVNATYKLVSHTYWLVDNGGGMAMFKGLDVTYLGLDNQALVEYITALKGEIGTEYANAGGDGRITLKTGPDPEPDPEPVTPDPQSKTEDAGGSSSGSDGSGSTKRSSKQGLPQTGDASQTILAGAAAVAGAASVVAAAALRE